MLMAATIFIEMYVETIPGKKNQTTVSIRAISVGVGCEKCFPEQASLASALHKTTAVS